MDVGVANEKQGRGSAEWVALGNEVTSPAARMVGVKAVLFDLGGTLWEPFGGRTEDQVTVEAAANAATAALHPGASSPEVRALAGSLVARLNFMKAARRAATQVSFADPSLREDDMVKVVADALALAGVEGPWSPERVEALADRFGRDLTRHFHLYEDAVPALTGIRSLRPRPVLGIVSNTSIQPRIMDYYLEQCALARLMDFRVLSSETGWRKPHPTIYAAALAEARAKPAEALFVGDRLVEDIAGPSRLGIRTALCRASADRPPAAAGVKPDIEAPDLWGILAALRG